jgi:hypothetical protein
MYALSGHFEVTALTEMAAAVLLDMILCSAEFTSVSEESAAFIFRVEDQQSV